MYGQDRCVCFYKVPDDMFRATMPDAGNTDGQWLLGRALLEGRGVARDATAARKLFLSAAAGGARRAAFYLGLCAEYGLGGLAAPDFAEAARQYGVAAAQNDPEAQYFLALLHAYGRGVKQDFAAAAALLRGAAHQGHAASQLMLGKFCMHGHGSPVDYECALAWFDKASHAVAAMQGAEGGAADGRGGIPNIIGGAVTGTLQRVAEEAQRARTELVRLLELAENNMESAHFGGEPLPHARLRRDLRAADEAAEATRARARARDLAGQMPEGAVYEQQQRQNQQNQQQAAAAAAAAAAAVAADGAAPEANSTGDARPSAAAAAAEEERQPHPYEQEIVVESEEDEAKRLGQLFTAA